MVGPYWILGMRRSGTTMLWNLCNASDSVRLDFEPWDLWYAMTPGNIIPRLKTRPATTATLNAFDAHRSYQHEGGIKSGAKLCLNPSIEAFRWHEILETYPDSRFIFITRNWEDVWDSYYEEDKDKSYGTVSEGVHKYFWYETFNRFVAYRDKNPETSVLVHYGDILEDKGTESMAPVWNLLGVDPVDVSRMIKEPRHTEGMKVTV